MRLGRDLTVGNPLKLIFFYSLPIFFGSVFQNIYSVVDSVVVGRFAGADKLAAVGATGSLGFFILGFVFGLTGGFTVMIAQRYGAKDDAGVRKAVGNSIILSAVMVCIITLLSMILAKPLLIMMGTPDDIINNAHLYIMIIFGGTVFNVIYNMISSILRAMGDSKTPLYFLILASFINVGLDLFFVINLGWGVAGVAIATVISQAISGILCVIYAVKNYPVLRLSREDLKYDRKLCGDMLKMGFPMALQSSITAAGMLIMQGAINSFGSVAVASYTAAGKVEGIVAMFAFSLSPTMANYAGQNYGAKKYDRISKGFKAGVTLIVGYAIFAAAVCVFGGEIFMGAFVSKSDPNRAEMLRLGMIYLRIYACFLLPFNALFILRSTLQGIGKSIYTLVGGIMEFVMRTAISFTLPALIGFAGICLAGPAAWVGADIPLIIAFIYEMKKLRSGNNITAAEAE